MSLQLSWNATASGIRHALSATALVLLGSMSLLGMTARPASAQDTAKPVPTAVVGKDYILGVDDVLSLSAIGHDELAQPRVTVLPNGKINVVGIREDIQAEGLTLIQLRQVLLKGLSRLYNNLELSLSLLESRSHLVTIIGTRQSGPFSLRKDMRISTLIAASGGLLGRPKLTVGSLIRNYKVVKLDIAKIIGPPADIEADLVLQINDEVILDTLEEPTPHSYSVLGAVLNPNNFPLPKDGAPVTVARAIAEARGPGERAALSRTTLVRTGKQIPLNLVPLIVEGKADSGDAQVLLQDGDVIVVPETDAKFMVIGQVNRPASYPLPDYKKFDILKALAEAGGESRDGDIRNTSLVRYVKGKQVTEKINLQKMLSKADFRQNYTIQDGDIIFVPIKGKTFELQDVLSPLFYLSYLGFHPFK